MNNEADDQLIQKMGESESSARRITTYTVSDGA